MILIIFYAILIFKFKNICNLLLNPQLLMHLVFD